MREFERRWLLRDRMKFCPKEWGAMNSTGRIAREDRGRNLGQLMHFIWRPWMIALSLTERRTLVETSCAKTSRTEITFSDHVGVL